jgi:hypothetical protein
MSGAVNDLVRDAASLYRFIGSIYARRDEPERTHRPATDKFLRYIRDLGESAKEFLQASVQMSAGSSTEPQLSDFEGFDRQGLTTVREFWNILHEFVRPVEDAHTLGIPVALIEFLEQLLSKVPKLADSQLVISHTPELNYFQYPRGDLRYFAKIYETIVPGAPTFPPKIALIGMPYSQAANLFLNLVICHELGHFVFEELELERRLSPLIEKELKEALSNYAELSEPDLSWCRKRLRSWSEEIYCDRFAVGLIGPAYCFAYIELFDVVGISDAAETEEMVEFQDEHPSDACRFREWSVQLTDGGWWNLLDKTGRTTYVPLIKRLASIDENKYQYNSEQKPQCSGPVLTAFNKLKQELGQLITESFGPTLRRYRPDTDCNEIEQVRRYLSYGIVPSTLVKGGGESFPDGVALINAAYLFYLESLPDLIHRIKDQASEKLSQRCKWGERTEMWTLKALEDSSLRSDSKELNDGGTIGKGY